MTAMVPSDIELLRALYESSDASIIICDSNGFCFRVLHTQPGLQGDGSVVTTLYDLLDIGVVDQQVALIRDVLHNGQRQTLRFSRVSIDQEQWYEVTVTPLHATLVLWMARDITKQYMLEQAQARLELFEALAERSLDGIAIATLDAHVSYGNVAYKTMTGYGDTAIGMSFLDMYPADVRTHITEHSIPTLLRDGTWHGHLAACRPDGSSWTMQISTSVLPGAPGQPPLIAAIIRDVTPQAQLEQRLRLFELLVEKASDGIVVADLVTTNLTYMNPAYRAMSSFGDVMLGRSFVEHFAEDPAYLAHLVELTMQQGHWRGELTYKRADGTPFPGDLTAYVIPASLGQRTLIVGLVRDLTEQQRQAAEHTALQAQVIQAQQAMLRELSTPLVPIARGVVAMPLIGVIDSVRAQQIMETLLHGIADQQVHYAILDITGVKVVDTYVANALVRVAHAARLLGAQVILTGLRPEVAQTVVQLGADLAGIITRGTVETGIAYALAGSPA